MSDIQSIYMCDECDTQYCPCILVVPSDCDVPHKCPYNLYDHEIDGNWYYIGDCGEQSILHQTYPDY